MFHITWTDKKSTGAKGWIVFDNVVNGVAGGGIFMHDKATYEETADIARNMSKKFTVTDPQIGGAKAGICFDHTDPRAKGVLARFIEDNAFLLNNIWVTAGDLNTDDIYIEKVIQKRVGLPSCQALLGSKIAIAKKIQDQSPKLSKAIGIAASPFFPLIEGAVGYGVASAIKQALEFKSPELIGKARIIIQGFGAVGSSLAYYFEKYHIGKVVAIADKDGFIFDSEGLPIDELLQKRKTFCASNSSSESKKNICVVLSEEERAKYNFKAREEFKTNEDFFEAFVSCTKAEIVSPCAMRYQITPQTVNKLLSTVFKDVEHKFVVAGANNCFGIKNSNGSIIEDKANVCSDLLEDQGVFVVPDWIANSGTAQLFHQVLSHEYNLDDVAFVKQILEDISKPIIKYVATCFLRNGSKIKGFVRSCLDFASYIMQNPKPLQKAVTKNPNSSIYNLPEMEDSQMLPLEKRISVVKSVGCECVTGEDLVQLLTKCKNPVAYDGFEPSGRMHIAQGVLKAINVNKLTQSGFTFLFWVADWFALLNNKMGGELERIRVVGEYFIEIWKACGMNMDRVKFLWASEEILKRHDQYWDLVFDMAKEFSLQRVKRCNTIMGRNSDNDSIPSAQILYPIMQCADIFFLGVDVCQLGLDQRKVNMLAREYAEKKKINPPVILSHAMLPGLKENQEKMSKSDPASAIFMEDSAEEVEQKIRKAYCPPQQIENNPVLEYWKSIVLEKFDKIVIERQGQDAITICSVAQLIQSYSNGDIHPVDLKTNLVKYLNIILEPVRRHFSENARAKNLLEKVKQYRVTK